MADLLCSSYEKGDSPYYLAEYNTQVSALLNISVLWEVYDYLGAMDKLAAKRRQVLNAYKKAEKLTPALEKRISHITDTHELDDLLIVLRPNPRSKGQLALKKGVEPLADIVMSQKEEAASLEDLAAPYIGKDPSLKTAGDVIGAVKDLLAERFSYDETVRAMAREFLYDDGFFEVSPKNRKDEKYSKYAGKSIPVKEISNEELLRLFIAEDDKAIKLKLNVQLFRITELFRHHFISNPDSVSFDCICEVIDDMWLRLLHPSVESDVKERFRTEAQAWAGKEVISGLTKYLSEELSRSSVFVVDAAGKKDYNIVAVSSQGDLLGATTEKKAAQGKQFALSERLRQFFIRHRPNVILVPDTSEIPEELIKQINANLSNQVEVKSVKMAVKNNPSQSDYMQNRDFAILEPHTRDLFGLAIIYLQPLSMIPHLGTSFYKIHPLQDALTEEGFSALVNRVLEYVQLIKGISIKDVVDSPLSRLRSVSKELPAAIRAYDAAEPIDAKNDLLKVKGMSESAFRNIAGFIVIPNGEDPIDRSTVHPEQFPLIEQIVNELTVSHETMVSNPDVLNSFDVQDSLTRTFLQKKLIPQLQTAQRFQSLVSQKSKRKIKLAEVKEGVVVSGKVTNITQFGVFVNINAVCDGLIHISQLADEYVETPDQVVAVGDRVDVRILKVDTKKRRISLSMKNLGNKAPKVKPSKGQLDNLAEHFKNR
ncbi:MAG: S1 RNA-binding domain-containing protein [Chitinispirillales bacterium]|nr:S1 RNA-binding domain-containing protein [Chitinispirillales bacterium]